jgi:Icc protein
MKRKTFLQTSAAVIGGSFLPSLASADQVYGHKKPLRFAHITDIHVKPGVIPETGMAKALHHVQQLKPGVQFIINGGDSIMDALEADKSQTTIQWDLFHKILNNENSLPIYHCIGNHDVWGWFISQNKPENDPLYGKGWVVETQKMKGRYYGFDEGNWHFIILDSTQLNPEGGYIGKIDPEQLDWLQKELASVPADRFICIVSHIPMLSIVSGLFFGKTETNGDLITKRNLMHTDFFAMKNIFLQYPNIKVCLSGHTHLQDELIYLGVKYYCNGAISGNWWKGNFQDFPPAYAVIELYDDGYSKRTIIKYE